MMGRQHSSSAAAGRRSGSRSSGFGLSSSSRRALAAVALLLAGALQGVAADTRICLSMIAKNEKKDLPRCLKEFGPELSGWVLCDTGSTDGTPQIAKQMLTGDLKVPGTVAYHKWQDFSANRNKCIDETLKWSLKQAKKARLPKGSHFCEYMLFLDADHFLHRPEGAQPGDLKAMNLTEPVYFMTERGHTVTYTNVRLASTQHAWHWQGEVHEYVSRVDGVWADPNSAIDPSWWLEHDASGGQTGDRFVRDEKILAKAVTERPDDPRARFYLGNTYRALRRFDEATTHYIVRIQQGGWDEERYLSALHVASFARDAYHAGRLVNKQIKEHLATWDSQYTDEDAEDEAEQEEEMQAARAALNETATALMEAEKAAAAAKNSTPEAGAQADTTSTAATSGSSSSTAAASSSSSEGSDAGGSADEDEEAVEAPALEGDQAAAAPDPNSLEARHPALSAQLKERTAVLEALVASRRTQELPWVLAAYWAAAQLLPYRPEAWVQLAKLHRLERGDHERCYSYATAALAQGQMRADSLFLDARAARYEVMDEVCTCGYWVGARVADESQVVCRQLEERLAADLHEAPGHPDKTQMLSRVRANLKWYEWKSCAETKGEDACPTP